MEGEGRGGTSPQGSKQRYQLKKEGKERKKKERKGCRAVLHKTVSVKAEKEPFRVQVLLKLKRT